MSNQLTRIEREAKEWDGPRRSKIGKTDGYIAGATAEANRAAPLLKALEKIRQWARIGQDGHSTVDRKELFSLIEGECETILEQYKKDKE